MDLPEKENELAPETGGARIGPRLRELRQKRGLTLQQVAEETGFALSFLSLLERDKVTITIDNLSRLARFYGIRMVNLFEEEDSRPLRVFRAASLATRAGEVSPGRAAFTLLADRRSRLLEPLHIVIGPGGGDPDFRTHEGESVLCVLEGSVELLIEGEPALGLERGDIAWYLGSSPHRLRNGSAANRAAFLLATAPPTAYRDRAVDHERRVILQSEDD
jgi:transcriptional regulator with XRE-family HTH domain